MCGFYGFTGGTRRDVELGLKQIAHRGPDEKQIAQVQSTVIGHVRLSIVGINSGRQPAEVLGGYLLYNGEIYNYRDLILKYDLSSSLESDTDVLVALYNTIGWDKMLAEIRGMFSLAVVLKDEILLARDRYGQKPLYYTSHNNKFQFGSDLLSFNLERSLSNIDTIAINYFMSFAFIPSPLTIWKGVCKVEPGQCIKYDIMTGKMSKQYYYNILDRKYYSDANFEELLQDSVRNHSISDVGANILLSGGVDSSLLALYANNSTKLFTVRWRDKEYNESKNAIKISRKLNRDLNIIDVNPQGFEKSLSDIVNVLGEPFADDGMLSLDAVLNSIQNKGEKVVISGDAADELFGGYNRYNIDLYLSLLPNILLKNALKIFRKGTIKYSQIDKLLSLKNSRSAIERHYRISQIILNDDQRQDLLFSYQNIYDDVSSEMMRWKNISKSKWKYFFDVKFLIEGNMMVKGDRMSMKNSLELRVPFLDEYIVEKALLGERKNIKFGIKKFHLKKIFVNKFGLSTLQRKKGFGAPLLTDYQDSYHKALDNLKGNKQLLLWNLMHRDKTLKALDVNNGNFKRFSFALLVLSKWLEKHLD